MHGKLPQNHYAFIDSQNVYRGIESLGWKIDWVRFRRYLAEKYGVDIAYLFIGYVAKHNDLYDLFQKAGFVVKFKPTIPDGDGNIKGNVDADLVLQAMLDYEKYDQAVIITSDGDFYSLVRHLYDNHKLRAVLSPYKKTCSSLLKQTDKEKIIYMDNLTRKIGDGSKTKNTAQGQNP